MKTYYTLALIFLTLTANSQDSDSTQHLRFGTYLGFTNLYSGALQELNQQLRSAQRLDLDDDILGVNVGFTRRFAGQNSYVASRFSFFSMTDTEDSDDHTRLNIWEFSAVGHYDLLPNDNWLAYPYLGVGANIATLRLLRETPASFQASLNSTTNDIIRNSYVTDLMYFADLGLGVERALRFQDATLFIGAKGGYRLSFSEPWSVDGLRYFTESEFSTQGWMFEIVLRTEITDSQVANPNRGLFKFFQ